MLPVGPSVNFARNVFEFVEQGLRRHHRAELS